jgi:hypothetical protein
VKLVGLHGTKRLANFEHYKVAKMPVNGNHAKQLGQLMQDLLRSSRPEEKDEGRRVKDEGYRGTLFR